MGTKSVRPRSVEAGMRRERSAMAGELPFRAMCAAETERLLHAVCGLMALATLGCARPPHNLPLSVDPAGQPLLSQCGWATRSKAICSQLERLKLTSPERGPVDFRIVDCKSEIGTAFVGWRSGDAVAATDVMAVTFRYPRGSEPLVPIRLDPVAMEWPCVEHCEHVELETEVPVVDQCEGTARLELRTLTLPAVSATSCLGAALRSGARHDFCREPVVRGATIYRIATRSPRFDTWREVRMEVGAGELFARVTIHSGVGAVRHGVVEVAPWEERLAAVWELPSEVRESCSEEGLDTVTAVRDGAWRVVVRRCTSVIDLRDLVLTTSRMGAVP